MSCATEATASDKRVLSLICQIAATCLEHFKRQKVQQVWGLSNEQAVTFHIYQERCFFPYVPSDTRTNAAYKRTHITGIITGSRHDDKAVGTSRDKHLIIYFICVHVGPTRFTVLCGTERAVYHVFIMLCSIMSHTT